MMLEDNYWEGKAVWNCKLVFIFYLNITDMDYTFALNTFMMISWT